MLSCRILPIQWRRQILDAPSSLPNFFHFYVFSGNFGRIIGWSTRFPNRLLLPHPFPVGDLLRKSRIRHCCGLFARKGIGAETGTNGLYDTLWQLLRYTLTATGCGTYCPHCVTPVHHVETPRLFIRPPSLLI